MKKLIATILTLTALSVGASEITRIDFMQMVEDRDSSLNSVMEPAMFIQRSGQTLERRTVSYRKKYGVDEKSLVRFEKPADVRYTMYLHGHMKILNVKMTCGCIILMKALSEEFPAEERKKLLCVLANEDLQKREMDDDTHRLIGKREFSGINCYEVGSVPVKKR